MTWVIFGKKEFSDNPRANIRLWPDWVSCNRSLSQRGETTQQYQARAGIQNCNGLTAPRWPFDQQIWMFSGTGILMPDFSFLLQQLALIISHYQMVK